MFAVWFLSFLPFGHFVSIILLMVSLKCLHYKQIMKEGKKQHQPHFFI